MIPVSRNSMVSEVTWLTVVVTLKPIRVPTTVSASRPSMANNLGVDKVRRRPRSFKAFSTRSTLELLYWANNPGAVEVAKPWVPREPVPSLLSNNLVQSKPKDWLSVSVTSSILASMRICLGSRSISSSKPSTLARNRGWSSTTSNLLSASVLMEPNSDKCSLTIPSISVGLAY